MIICQKLVENLQRTCAPPHVSFNIFTTACNGVGKSLLINDATSLTRACCFFRFVVRRRGCKRSSSFPGGHCRSALAWKRPGHSGDETEALLRENFCHGMGQGWICCQSILRKEPSRLLKTPMQLFQDHSMAWYRVTWKVSILPYWVQISDLHNRQEDNPLGSLQREARWRPQPTPWNGQPTQFTPRKAVLIVQ